MEQHLASILSHVLDTAEISATLDFFDLGVDSLAAIEVAMKANEAQIPLPATALFEHRTLRALATYAEGLEPVEDEGEDDDLLTLDTSDLAYIAEALK